MGCSRRYAKQDGYTPLRGPGGQTNFPLFERDADNRCVRQIDDRDVLLDH